MNMANKPPDHDLSFATDHAWILSASILREQLRPSVGTVDQSWLRQTSTIVISSFLSTPPYDTSHSVSQASCNTSF